jgi:6-phosphogluconolactonase
MRTIEARTPEELYASAAAILIGKIREALAKRGACALGIVGGRSIPALLDAAARALGSAPHGNVHVFWLDERVHLDKNFVPALASLERLSHAGLAMNWHPLVSVEREAMELELRSCEERLALVHGTPQFDLVVLSAGEDGHVCSLFPGHDALRAAGQGYVLVEDAPKPPPLRVTVTPALLQTARAGILLFVGDKRAAYDKFLDPHASVDNCPAKLAQKIPDLTVGIALG